MQNKIEHPNVSLTRRSAASAPAADGFRMLGSGPLRWRDDEEERTAETSESVGWQNFGRMLLVFGCIGSDFCKKICVLQHFSKSTRFSS